MSPACDAQLGDMAAPGITGQGRSGDGIDECYYSGYVEDVLDSQVILSTCAGLWGHVKIGTLSYEIEPIENSPTFQHLIYRKTPKQREPCRGIVEDGSDLTSDYQSLYAYVSNVPLKSIGYFGGKCRRLSNCSREVYYDTISKPGKECLLDIPTKLFRRKVCGNGVTDDDEECDCGQDKDCRVHGCCKENCKLKANIDCLYGLCCEECKFLEERTLCRKSATECDLPEYCSGTSANCPPDVYKQDGMPCSNDNNCFQGNCLDLESQCVILFGEGAERAPLNCFKELNMRGDRSGNCGAEDQKYKKCHEQDVLCGRIQCTHVKKIPKMATGQGVVQTAVENTLCWGTEFHLGFDVYDIGAVRDGTTCGLNKMCLNRSCVDVAVLNYDCDFSGCNNHGVCNSKRHCHCSYGWAPPFCSGRGYGGSVDSGPPPPSQISTSVLVGLITLSVLAVIVLGLFIQRNKLQAR
ncbi:disintegrin and metalloproteinase domain-containing protein 20-like [Elgaria multicarinata webbii]|uniref:disintegrin and metalloproteinase domain-containing protein 20-like n=1 Tax=Elgaria multicarinata webbii TaxID=159646 RepID=UPI002FCCD012